MRTALYVRVSTDEQVKDGLSLEAQRAALKRYASDHGLNVVGVYEDDGISARASYRKRVAFSKLIEDVKHDRIDLILFIKLDRWFRSVSGYYEIQKILDEHNVQWNAILEDYDTTTANGRLHLNIRLSIAQDEADRTSERTKFVLNLKRERGEYVGGAPLGYTKKDSQLVPNDSLPAVTDIFDTYLDTRSLGATQRMLNDKYGISLSKPGLRVVLKNKHYAELGAVPAETIRQATEILLSRSQRNSESTTYIFSGLLYCAKCGRRMTAGSAGAGKPSYYCQTFRTYQLCERNSISERRIEQLLVDRLPAAVHEENLLVQQEASSAPDIPALNKRLEKIKDLYMDDLISKEMYKAEYKSINAQIALASQARRVVDESELASAMTLYEGFTREEKKAFWSRIVRRVYVRPGSAEDDRIEELTVL